MPKTPKHQTCGKGWCNQHVFSLAPIAKTTYFKRIQKVRMCPVFNKNQKKFFKVLPMYNRDKKFYTPTFLAEQDKNFDEQKDQRYKNNHIKRANENPSGTSELLVPNLGRKNKYCNVCREDFVDYLQHCGSQGHRKSLRANKYSAYIGDFSRKYKKMRQQTILCRAPSSQNGLQESTQLQNLLIKSDRKQMESSDNLQSNQANLQISVKFD